MEAEGEEMPKTGEETMDLQEREGLWGELSCIRVTSSASRSKCPQNLQRQDSSAKVNVQKALASGREYSRHGSFFFFLFFVQGADPIKDKAVYYSRIFTWLLVVSAYLS